MCVKVLLSIKPKFADLIFQEVKRYEFRRTIFKSNEVKTVVVYSSNPIQKVIGEFEIERIISNPVKKLWQETESLSGIGKDRYDDYFQGKKTGYAIKIKSVRKYKKPKCLQSDFNIKHPPQSFVYLNND